MKTRALTLKKRIIAFSLIIVLLLSAFPISAFATSQVTTHSISEKSSSDANSAAFSVQAILPDNQEGDFSYFNLRMEPKQQQVISVEVFSQSEKDNTIYLRTTNGQTNSYGEIDYNIRPTYDDTDDQAFTNLVTTDKEEFILPAGESVIVDFTITMPDEPFDGSILGGIHFLRKTDEIESTKETTNFNNDFAYLIGVVLFENDSIPMSDFKIDGVTSEVINYRPSFVASLVNSAAKIAKENKLEVNIYKYGKLYLNHVNDNISFAPNSRMDYTLPLEETDFEAGSYRAEVKLTDSENKTWSFEDSFTIDGDEVEQLSEQIISPTVATNSGAPIWMYIAAAVLATLLIVLLVFGIYKLYKKNHPELKHKG